MGGVLRILLREITGAPVEVFWSVGMEVERGVELESQGVEAVRVEGGVERRDSGLLIRDPVLDRNPLGLELLGRGAEWGNAGLELLIRGEGLWRADLENMLTGRGLEFGIRGEREWRKDV